VRLERIFLVAALVGVALPANSTPARGPADLRHERGAFAMFALPARGDGTFPFVAALVFGYATNGGDEALFGVLLKGNCERERGDGWVSIGCRGRGGVGGRLRGNEFQMDPAMQSASLRLSKGRSEHEVRWVADGRPSPYQSSEWCYSGPSEEPEGEGHGGGVYQAALAKGTAFGRKLETSGRWIDLAEMDRGGMVSQCGYLSADDLRALRAGRYERVDFRIPVR